jgi:GNAT superfamily N-acetyltransferase
MNGIESTNGIDGTSGIEFRPATESDIPAVVALLADDALGATRESPDDLSPYRTAFTRLRADDNQLLIVAVRESDVVGTMQLSFIPGLSRRGSTRCLIEAVRVAGAERGNGLGSTMIEWAIEESRRRGCALVQLTSNRTRTRAHRFYQRLGFSASHLGFKLEL